jgi:hypothetical protein
MHGLEGGGARVGADRHDLPPLPGLATRLFAGPPMPSGMGCCLAAAAAART